MNAPCLASIESSSTLSVIFNYLAIGLTLFLTIYSAMNSSAVTAMTSEEKPPLFCCCYAWEFDKMDQINMKGQDVVEDDYER